MDELDGSCRVELVAVGGDPIVPPFCLSAACAKAETVSPEPGLTIIT
jgi:hypothetical protein